MFFSLVLAQASAQLASIVLHQEKTEKIIGCAMFVHRTLGNGFLQLEDVHLAQAKNYLQAYHMETGLLINFGAKSLQFKRIFP